MPVELRKRKAPEPAPAPAPARKKNGSGAAKASSSATKAAKVVEKVKEAVVGKAKSGKSSKKAEKETEAEEAEAPAEAAQEEKAEAEAAPAEEEKPASNGGAKKVGKPTVGETIELGGFGGEVTTHDGETTSLKALVEESKAGVVLFTYPKASTPGCTTQACLFRDAYAPLTATGLAIYGLSTDSPKSNTAFKTKQNLPYPLLCDPQGALIAAIGLRKPGGGKGTQRGVFVVNKDGRVLAAEPGGPAATVDVVKRIVGEGEAKL